MSATTALHIDSRRPRIDGRERTSERVRPTLYLVRGTHSTRTGIPFLLLISGILIMALAASTLLNAAMARTAFDMQRKQVELNVISDHIDTVRSQVQDVSAADNLAARATELGMVPAGAPGVVDLTTSHLSAGQSAKAK